MKTTCPVSIVTLFIFLILANPLPVQAVAMEFKIDGIENNPSEINYDQSIEILYSFANVVPTKIYYLAGVFQKEAGSNYFGFTENNNWYKYGDEYTNLYKVEIKESSFSGKLKIKPDIDSSGFKGTGDYLIKIFRYTSQSSYSPTEAVSIKIIAPPSPSPSPAVSPSASPNPSPSPSPSPSPQASKSPSPKPSPSPSFSPEESIIPESATPEPEILGATDEAKPKNPYGLAIIFMALGLIFIGTSAWGIIKYGKDKKI